MAARAEADAHVLLTQEVVRAHDVVDALDLVVDVLDASSLRGKQGDTVVYRIDSQQRRIAYPVAHTSATYRRPEHFVLAWRDRMEPDVREAGDAGVPRGKVTPAAMRRSHDQLDRITARVLERYERIHPPLL